MTKVARLFEEEKIEAVNEAVSKTRRESIEQVASNMLLQGIDHLKVMECTGLTRDDIDRVQATLAESA